MVPIYLVLMSLLLASACTAHNPAAPSALVNAEALVRLLEHVGAQVSIAEQVPSDAFPFFRVNATRILVQGQRVNVFEYLDETSASDDAARVDPSGTPIGGTQITWLEPPRFYTRGRLIVLYVGRDREVSGMLETVLGRPFAGAR